MENTEPDAQLSKSIQDYNSAKQSLNRMSVRLKKLCKRLEPTSDIVNEMREIAAEICKYAQQATKEYKQ